MLIWLLNDINGLSKCYFTQVALPCCKCSDLFATYLDENLSFLPCILGPLLPIQLDFAYKLSSLVTFSAQYRSERDYITMTS